MIDRPANSPEPARSSAGLLDARLVVPAAACWLALLLSQRWSGAAALVVAGSALVAAALVSVTSTATSLRAAAVASAAALMAFASGAGVAGVRTLARNDGPLRTLAADGVVAEMTVMLSADPTLLDGVSASTGRRYHLILMRAQVTQLDSSGHRWLLRQPVLMIATDQKWADLLPSQRVRTAGKLSVPRAGDRVSAVVAIRGPPRLLGRPSPLQRAAGHVRAGLRQAVSGLPDGPAALLPGLVDGDTRAITPRVTAEFRTTGLTHLVAVSGTNVAIVTGVVVTSARRARAGPRLTACLACLCVVGFVVLARPTGSVLRAAVMGLLGLAGVAAARPRPALTGLAGAVLVLLLVEPGLATQPGFALSVLATLGLLVLAPGWTRWLARWVPEPVAVAISVPTAAQVACAPVIAMIGGGLSLVAIPANLIAAPAVAPATVFGVSAAALAGVLPWAARCCAWIAVIPCAFLLAVAHVGARVPFASVSWPDGRRGALLMLAVTPVAVASVRHVILRCGRSKLVGGESLRDRERAGRRSALGRDLHRRE